MEISLRNYAEKDYEVSAIVSTYKSEEFMAECIEDLERQSLADRLEIVIVDADSPEGERDIVLDYQERYDNIKYFRTERRIGVYAAWNIAIRESTGRFLTTSNTNDRLFPRSHEALRDALLNDAKAALVYGNYYTSTIKHQDLNDFTYDTTWVWEEHSHARLLTRCLVGPQPMWRRQVHTRHGYFDEKYLALGDQEFWLRIGRDDRIINIPEFIGLIWLSETSLSRSNRATVEEAKIRKQYLEPVLAEQQPQVARFTDIILGLLAAGRLGELLTLYKAKRHTFVDTAALFALDAELVRRLNSHQADQASASTA